MRTINKIDVIVIILGFLLVIAIFTLAYVLSGDNEQCALNPCNYAMSKNISCMEYEIAVESAKIRNEISKGNEGVFNFSKEEMTIIMDNEDQI